MKKLLADNPLGFRYKLARRLTIVTMITMVYLLIPLQAKGQDGDARVREQTRVLNALLTQNKHEELQAAAEKIKEETTNGGNIVLYYYAWRYQIIDLRNQVKLYEALREANAMLKQVNKEKGMSREARHEVVFMSYEVLGKIFEARGDYKDAAIYLNKAIASDMEDLKQNGYEISIYNALARVYRNDEKYEQSLDAAEKGLELSKEQSPTTFKLLQSKAFALYYLGRRNDFMATYKDMARDYGNKENFDRLNIRKYAYEKKFAEAHRLADKTKEERERIREHLLVYMAQQDWKSAFTCEKKLSKVETERQQSLLGKDLANLSTKYDAERLRADNYQLEIENSRVIGFFIVLFAILVVIVIYIMLKQEKNHVAKLSKANKDLAEARDKAEASDRMKTRFVQNISHEIRTPLNAIVGFSDLLTTPDLELSSDEKREFSNTISSNTTLLTNLVNDMLELSDLQSGDAKADMESCSCNEICRTVLSAVIDTTKDVKIRFTTDVDDNYTINTDHVRLGMALNRLLSNAKKYTTQGEIVLDCSASKRLGYVTFSVTDTGCGVPKEKQSQLFKSFEKVNDFQQGAGLGLYLCSMIARLLKADIGIDSTYTSGARFYISVPREPTA